MGLVLDSGALIGFKRGEPVITSSGCVAQVWRSGPAQAFVARLLRGICEQELDREISRQVGQLCGEAGSNDVVDAHLALLAHDGDVVLTSDGADLGRLVRVGGSTAHVQNC